jgi:ankyrin repeat protein
MEESAAIFLRNLSRGPALERKSVKENIDTYRTAGGAGILYALVEENERELFARYVNVEDVADGFTGQSGLMLAMRAGWNAEVLEMLKHKPSVTIDKDGNSLLHYAAVRGSVDVINRLLVLSFKPDLANRFGLTAWKAALEFDNAQAVEAMIAFDAGRYVSRPWMEDAIRSGRDYAVEQLAKRVALNNTGSDEIPLLLKAVLFEKRTAFNTLVSHGADTRVKDVYGNNILHYLVHAGWDDLTAQLAASQPDLLNRKNNDGKTPLQILQD